jgi:hypothetical protein
VARPTTVGEVSNDVPDGAGVREARPKTSKDTVGEIEASQRREQTGSDEGQAKHEAADDHRGPRLAEIDQLSGQDHGDRTERRADRETERNLRPRLPPQDGQRS